MITAIAIRNLGVIERAELPLEPGFTAITGETGAGKTFVVTALGLLLGGRAAATSVRAGADRAVVDGRMDIAADGAVAAMVSEAGGEVDAWSDPDGRERADVLLSRQILASGRSRAWLGGQSVPVGLLADAGEELVAVHGQSEQLRLTREQAQRDALDAFGGAAIATARSEVADAFDRAVGLRAELTGMRASSADRAAERENLQGLVVAFEAVDPKEDEDAELLARIERLSNREALRADIGAAHALLTGDERPGGSVRDAAREVQVAVERAIRHDAGLERALEGAVDLAYAIDDLALTLAGYLDELDTGDIGALDSLNARLAQIESLKREQNGSIEQVRHAYERAGLRLLELGDDETRIPELEEQLERAEQRLAESSGHLHELREEAAARLASEVSEELTALAMPHAHLRIRVERRGEPARHGDDRIAFELAPHPGVEPLPLAKGASGGELSRVMLALEVVLAGANPVPTLVFDEIDAGVGGAAALEIGRRLHRLARTSQVLVVTHLAQVAAFADHHLVIEKSVDGAVTASSIRELDDQSRITELTRLLSGLSDSESGRAHATELRRLAVSS